jgi:hypothetical protein
MAMRSEAHTLNHPDSISNCFSAFGEEKSFQLQAEEVEARLQRVCVRHKDLDAASHLVWLDSGPHVYDPDLNLRVKVDAVRWMLRIAKHMSESAREVVFLQIENSLRQLEAAVESRVRSAKSGAPTERIHLVATIQSPD